MAYTRFQVIDSKLRLIFNRVEETHNKEYTIYQSQDSAVIVRKTGEVIIQASGVILKGLEGIEGTELVYVTNSENGYIQYILDTNEHKLIHVSREMHDLIYTANLENSGLYCEITREKVIKLFNGRKIKMKHCDVKTTSGRVILEAVTAVRLVDSRTIRYSRGGNIHAIDLETGEAAKSIGKLGKDQDEYGYNTSYEVYQRSNS